MKKAPQLYKFSEIKHRLQTLEPGKSYIKPFVTSKVSDTMCGGLNFLNKVSVPWDFSDDGSEGACLAADLSVGPPVDAALPKDRWVPHPNPDLTLRFMEEVTSHDLIAIGTCREMSRGFAIVQTEVWQDQSLVATGVSTSLLTANS